MFQYLNRRTSCQPWRTVCVLWSRPSCPSWWTCCTAPSCSSLKTRTLARSARAAGLSASKARFDDLTDERVHSEWDGLLYACRLIKHTKQLLEENEERLCIKVLQTLREMMTKDRGYGEKVEPCRRNIHHIDGVIEKNILNGNSKCILIIKDLAGFSYVLKTIVGYILSQTLFTSILTHPTNQCLTSALG